MFLMVKPNSTQNKSKHRGRKNYTLNNKRHWNLTTNKATNLLYGKHAVLSALANPRRKIGCLLLTPDTQKSLLGEVEEALCIGGHDNIKILTIDRRKLDKNLPTGTVHQGIALETQTLNFNLEEILVQTSGNDEATIVILDQATDTNNIGSIVRSAAAFNVDAIIIQDRKSPIAHGTIAKAASGALEHVAIVRTTNLVRTMDKLKAANYWCVGLDGNADKTLVEAKLTGRIVMVLGSEGVGLRRLIRENCDLLVRVPINWKIDSLNLSNAAAIALYERTRN
ncbi:MAG: 23S rRNA (guanosine(2251)-2'-O)-methyltransferase RlmB [Magnetovibrio sp.]|nr:23S rRNA (guanosine(2251)-2'-O)-methyltransferase RlmB [Magnetovibrio sp.]